MVDIRRFYRFSVVVGADASIRPYKAAAKIIKKSAKIP